MCKISNKIKFCTCTDHNYFELQNSWIIFRRKTGWFVIGQTVYNESELQLQEIEIRIIENNLNSKKMFDFEYIPEEDDMLKIKLTYNNQCSEYDFKYSNNQWQIYSEKLLDTMEELLDDKPPYIKEYSGIIKNPFR